MGPVDTVDDESEDHDALRAEVDAPPPASQPRCEPFVQVTDDSPRQWVKFFAGCFTSGNTVAVYTVACPVGVDGFGASIPRALKGPFWFLASDLGSTPGAIEGQIGTCDSKERIVAIEVATGRIAQTQCFALCSP